MAVKLERTSSLEEIVALPKNAQQTSPTKKGARTHPYTVKRTSVDSIYQSLWQSSLYSRPRQRDLEGEEGKWWKLVRHSWVSRASYRFFRSHMRPNYILCCIPRKNRTRKKLKRVVNSHWFKWIIVVMVVLNALTLCFFFPYINEDRVQENQIIAHVTIIFEVVYIAEMCLKVLVSGLLLHPGAYLRRPSNLLDLGIIAFGLVYIIYWNGYIGEVLSAFMALKLFYILIHFETVRFILRALANSLSPLFYLGWLTVCVMAFFALLGMELFLPHCGLHYGCYVNYTDALGDQQSYRVSDYPCAPLETPMTGSHMCDQQPNRSMCEKWAVGPNSGINGFDNFGTAIVTVFQCMTLEGWTNILYLYESRFGTDYVWLYFVTLILLGSTIVLNLLLGVLTSVFLGVSDQQEAQGTIRKRKERQRIEEDLTNYRQWMQRTMEGDRREKMPESLMSESDDELGGRDIESEESEDEPEKICALSPCLQAFLLNLEKKRHYTRIVVKSHAFFAFMTTVVLVNLVALALSVYPPWIDEVIDVINYVCTAVYIMEFILKVFSLGPRKYFASFFNKLDFLCVFLNLVDLLVLLPISVQFPLGEIANTLRALRLVLIFKYTRHWRGLKDILQTLSELTVTILSLIGLMGALLVFFSLLGIRVFGTRLSVEGHHHPNYDDFISSALLVFQLFTTENWDRILEKTTLSYGYYSEEVSTDVTILVSFYYVIVVIIGGFIFLSIFLAVSVDKMSEAKEVSKDITMRTEQQQEMRKERQEQLDALKNTEDSSSISNTLYRLVKFYAVSQTQQHRQQQQQLKKQNRQKERAHSLQLSETHQKSAEERRGSFQKALSAPEQGGVTLNLDDEDVDMETSSELASMTDTASSQYPTVVMTTMKNPLTQFQQSLAKAEQRQMSVKRNLSLKSEPPGLSTTTSFSTENNISTVPSLSSMSSSVFGWKPEDSLSESLNDFSTGSRESFRSPQRQYSVHSEPFELLQSVSAPTQMPLNYTRTQSLPSCVRPSLTKSLDSSVTSTTVKFTAGTIEDEDEEQQDGEEGQKKSVKFPRLALVVPPNDNNSSARLERQSSLETIQPVGVVVEQEQHREKRKGLRASSTWVKVKAKGGKILDWLKEYLGTLQLDPREELQEIPNHSAFFILSPDNRLRDLCYKLVTSYAFQTINFAILLFGSLALALEVPIPSNIEVICTLQQVQIYIDILILIWFVLEIVLKMAALGVFLHKGSYFRSIFNMCDFFVTVFTAVPVILFFHNSQTLDCLSYTSFISTFVVLRVCRVLRPIRVIRVTGLYRVVRGIVASIKFMVYIFFVAFIVLVIFAVVGVQLFKGKFYYCTDPVATSEEECQGQYFTYPTGDLECPEVFNRTWERRPLHFDNIAFSMLTLYTMLTKEGWEQVMYSATDSTGVDTGPIESASRWTIIYFLLYMLLVSIFLLNLFVGFVIVIFQTVRVNDRKEAILDRNQVNCLYFALTVRPLKNFLPSTKCHAKLYRIAKSHVVTIVMSVVVFVNCIILAVQEESMGDSLRMILYYVNVGFTILFAVEAIVKIAVLTPPIYFRDFVRWFEFLVAFGSIVELITQFFLADDNPFKYSHIVSALRVLRLLQPIKSTQLILWTVVKSLEIFPWVGVLLVVVLYLYALIGMQVFGNIQVASIDDSATIAIHQYNNFANFPQAFLVMIRCFTGENWQQIMLSCVDAHCDASVTNKTECGSIFTYVFFPLFFFVSTILILNLFVAIIIDNFDYYVRDKSILGSHHLRIFPKLWSKCNTKKKELIHHSDVIKLMRSIDPPLGWGKLCPQTLAHRRMMQLDIPMTDEGYVSIIATLFSIVRWSHLDTAKGFWSRNTSREDKVQRLRDLFPRVQKKIIEDIMPTSSVSTTGRYYAALFIQHHWRQYQLKYFKRARHCGQMSLRRVPDMSQALLHRKLSAYHQQISVNQQEDLDVLVSSNPHSASPHSANPPSASPHSTSLHDTTSYSGGSSTHPVSSLSTNTLSISTTPLPSGDKKQALTHRTSGFLSRLPTIDEYSDSIDQQEERVGQSISPASSIFSSPNEVMVVAKEEKEESAPTSNIVGVLPSSLDRMSIQSDNSMYSTPRGSLSSLNSTTGTFVLETTV